MYKCTVQNNRSRAQKQLLYGSIYIGKEKNISNMVKQTKGHAAVFCLVPIYAKLYKQARTPSMP